MAKFLVRSILSDSETRKSGPKCLSAQISFHSFRKRYFIVSLTFQKPIINL